MSVRRSTRSLDTVLSIAAVAIVVGVLVGTVAVWLTAPDGPAVFELDVSVVDDRLDVEVGNTGGEVATEVVVQVSYGDTEAEQTLAWLSPGETNHVVFLVELPVELSEIEARVVSYVPND